MKNILALLAICLLPGCALIDAYLMTKYDPAEYRIVTEIRADAAKSKTQCEDAVVSKLNAVRVADRTQLFMFYSEHVPRNTNLQKSSMELNKIASGLVELYNQPQPPSLTFCRIKFDSIETNATTMQHIIGNRPR